MVERGIGQMKRRFHVLHGEIRLTPAKTCRVIMACAVLHNICKARNIQMPPDEDDDNSDDAEDEGEEETDAANTVTPQGHGL